MGDQQRWFKLWESALADDHLQRLSPALRWAWAAFGAYTKTHGTKGRVRLSEKNAALAGGLGIEIGTLKATISMLPHMHIEEGTSDNGEFTVTWHNWPKYQLDSTVAKRVASLRSKRRGEEKRGEEKKQPPVVPHGGTSNGFETFWSTYPRKVGKGAALKAWERLHPTNGQCEAIVAAVRVQCRCEQWTKNNGQFIPHPATWLNQRRFEDEVPAPAAPPAGPGPAGCRHCGWNLGHSPTCARPR